MSRWSTAIRRKHWGFVSTRTKRTHGTSTDSSSIRSGSSFQILSVSVIYSEVRFVIYWFTCTWILPENLKYWSWRSVLLFVVTDLTLWTLTLNCYRQLESSVSGGEEHLICDCFVFMFLVFLAHALYRWEEEEGGKVITSAPSLKIDLLCVEWSSSCCKATALIMIYLSECSSVCVVWHRLELSPRFPGDVTGSHPDSGMGISSA